MTSCVKRIGQASQNATMALHTQKTDTTKNLRMHTKSTRPEGWRFSENFCEIIKNGLQVSVGHLRVPGAPLLLYIDLIA